MIAMSDTASTRWTDVDDVIRYYEVHHRLPTPISPTLPKQYGTVELDKIEFPQMLSPTLPPGFDDGDDDDHSDHGNHGDHNDDSDNDLIAVSTQTRKPQNSERVEFYDRNLYKVIETSDGSKSVIVTLYVPEYYKNKKSSTTSVKPVGLGISNDHTSSSPSLNYEKSTTSALETAITKKSSIFNKNKANKRSEKGNGSSQFALKNEEFMKIAIDKKHKGDELRHSNLKLSIVYFIDSIITYLVGFQYEDLYRKKLNKLYNDKSWLSLISLIGHAYKLSIDNGFKDIAGLTLQIRAIVYDHLCRILEEYIKLNQVKKTKKSANEADELKINMLLDTHVKNYMRYKEHSTHDIMESEEFLSIFVLSSRYKVIVDEFKSQEHKNCGKESIMNMNEWRLHLPVMIGISMPELCHYSTQLMKEWCKKEDIKYSDWSF